MTANATAWHLPTPDEELAELEAAIGHTLSQPMGDAELDAQASEFLRQLATVNADDERYIEAFKLELEAMRQRYEKFRAPLTARRTLLENALKSLIDRADFSGKRRSRNVGHGTYGKRTKPERITVVDEAVALATLTDGGFEHAIREKVTRSVDAKAAAGVVLACLKADGEVLLGFEHVPASESYVIDPLPLNDAVEMRAARAT